jgi:RecA/RadA recombinase
MPSPAIRSLESLLQGRKLGNTLPGLTAPPRLLPTGIPEVDQAIGGGWRQGALSEIVGPRSAGRTHLLLATMARATRQGQVVALIDAIDRFDPMSAAAAGVDLDRVLWVRGAPVMAEQARPGVIDQAVKQAVRACDLILRAGGFAVVALDLRNIPPRRLQALPSITWLRLAQVTETQETVALLLGDGPIGRSARGVSVHLHGRTTWTGDSAQSRRLAGFTPAWDVRSASGYTAAGLEGAAAAWG